MSRLALFILVGTCMLISSAIASTSKADFLPRTRADRFIAAFLIALITGIIALVIYALFAHGTPATRATIERTPETIRHLPSATATPMRNPEVVTITPADPKVVTITQPISIAVRYGSVSVAAGTKLPFVSRAGDKVRIRYYDGADYDIAIEATDLK
jgi:hypothetical protein